MNPTTLDVAVERYALYRSLSPGATYQIRRSVQLYGQFLGRCATPDDLDDLSVSRWLVELQDTHSPRTVAGHRGNLLTIWRDCAAQGQCDPPQRVRRAPIPSPCPVAWTSEEFARVMHRVRQLPGVFPTGVSRAVYCEALCRVAYDTGLRRSDLWTLRKAQIRPDGTIVLRQHKTGHAHRPKIRSRAMELIGKIESDPPLACPYRAERTWYKFWRTKVIQPAGVRHGALQQIRRTGATHLAIDHPEAVQRYLGHCTAEMQAHYVDESIASPQMHLPPEIT